MKKEDILAIAEQYNTASADEILEFAISEFGNRLILASSLGAEDQVLTEKLCTLSETPRVFILDTGRLHQETYDTIATTSDTYGLKYDIFFQVIHFECLLIHQWY